MRPQLPTSLHIHPLRRHPALPLPTLRSRHGHHRRRRHVRHVLLLQKAQQTTPARTLDITHPRALLRHALLRRILQRIPSRSQRRWPTRRPNPKHPLLHHRTRRRRHQPLGPLEETKRPPVQHRLPNPRNTSHSRRHRI